jgi:3-methyl-2-oxobutanoate hydroxymethyltransferase
MDRLTIAALQAMKRAGRKIVGVVAWDTPMALIAERAGVDLVSVGDSVGVNLWGRSEEAPVSLAEMLLVCMAVRRGVKRALLSCDVPSGSLEDAKRLAEEGGADMVKVFAPAARSASLDAMRLSPNFTTDSRYSFSISRRLFNASRTTVSPFLSTWSLSSKSMADSMA